jgi:hypothetical protein
VSYETFLFTRNQRRDFTAFVRPSEMTNKEVSVIASAFNFINDVTLLTAEWPSLYCFPLGAYTLLLRHYNSGRKHAGREIGVIEGIAVQKTELRTLSGMLPRFITEQGELLNVVGKVEDIELLEITPSASHDWPEAEAEAEAEPDANAQADGKEQPPDETSSELVRQFTKRHMDDRLFLPFTEAGRAVLLAALADPQLPRLQFAFGTNADVVTRLAEAQIDMDVVSYFTTEEARLKRRDVTRQFNIKEMVSDEVRTAYLRRIEQPPEAPPPVPMPVPMDDTQPIVAHSNRQNRSLLRSLVDLLLGRKPDR